MSAAHPFVPGRDTCNGSCESWGGCNCVKQTRLTEQDLDAAIAAQRTFTAEAEEERERAHYCRGWRYGLVDGVFAGALFVFLAMKLGTLWGYITC